MNSRASSWAPLPLLTFDGVLFTSPSTGQFGNLRINRTNDYDPSKVGDMGPMPSIVLPQSSRKREAESGSGGGASGSGGDRDPA